MAGYPGTRIIIAALGALLLASCAAPFKPFDEIFRSPPTPAQQAPAVKVAKTELEPQPAVQAQVQVDPAPPAAVPEPNVWLKMRNGFRLEAGEAEELQRELAWYQNHLRNLETVFARSAPYLPYVLELTEARQLPTEIALLPVIESSYRPRARSRQHAVGLWQFMPATARAYGLQQNQWFDARGDIIASTDAALRLLENLNQRFDGDWLHTLAAYNCGARRVERAILTNRTHGRSTDFWSLDLPQATRHYVPRLLAVARIVAAPEQYRISLPEIPHNAGFATVSVKQQLSLNTAAELGGLDMDTLWSLNGGLKQRVTPPHRYEMLVPRDSAERLQKELAALPDEEWMRWSEHRVNSGESLWIIARQYRISVATLKQVNGLQSTLIKPGQRLLLPPGDLAVTSRPEPERSNDELAQADLDGDSIVRHQVREGDSLWLIARRYGVSVAELRRWNDLSDKRHLQPGQLINVPRSQAEEI